ncbi:uncharacterized protein FSUBG_10418 [Fusarium subglutinans]|uniref:Uncharacterized protein n=1 Tax=Gibberella subglutinans TaxID=42677 RepID=A0A8H5P7U1_GIBSU|nr:uncharacterized protein FSUBG_10418 [Fusarium subglutinans]KAF5591606.1 hypothetical protein FSUBG_10418 [Fusarium subglutinans]
MPLLLAPYNDAMRLGMGFNSYTQTMCIDSAVEATDEAMITSEKLSPKITTSSMLFDRLSEVADTMDISRAATITTGRMDVHGHMSAFNSAEIDDADISLMASVRVMSEITSLKGSARFLPIDGMEAGSLRFNETFGDSYISGFITGGLFISIISFIASDPDRKDKLIEAVKKGLTQPTMDLENVCKEFAIASVIQGVEVPDMNRAADVASILRIASQFPALVAQDPQRTCFNEWSSYEILKPLDYDGVASYTSKLFDNYMQYNRLPKKVQDIISQRDKYSQVDKPRAIPPELNALLAVRSAIDKEINSIVAVVNTLTRHPELLPKIEILNANLKDDLVQETLNEALQESSRPISQQETMVQEDPFLPSVADYAPSESSSGVEELHTPCTSDLDSCSISGRSPVLSDGTEPSTDLAMRKLVPPEVWADLLPVKNDQSTSLVSQPAKTAPAPAVKYKKLQILAAVCGTYDVTAKLQKWVSPGENGDRLLILAKDIKTLETPDSFGGLAPRATTNLSLIYEYTDMPMRICSFDHDAQSTETLEITHESDSASFVHESKNATSVQATRGVCYLLGVTYGGKVYSSYEDLRPFVECISPGGWPFIHFNRKTIKDEHFGGGGMRGVVFYTYSRLNGVQSAISVGNAGCMLVDKRQLANRADTRKEDADSLSKKNGKEGKPYQVTLNNGIEAQGESNAVLTS